MSDLRQFVDRFPRLKAAAKAVLGKLDSHTASSHYVELDAGEIDKEAVRLRSAWQDSAIPARQRELVERELIAWRRGKKQIHFSTMVQSLQNLELWSGPVTLLEIGCSSGYYSEVIAPLAPGFIYTGCDYSPTFVEMARQSYPDLQFDVEDAAKLNYSDNEFDIVVSGCCLLHIPEYEAAIVETARVARSFAVFHRTPVVLEQPQRVFRKRAHGVDTVEIHFNEQEFLDLLSGAGLERIDTYTLYRGVDSAVRTYVCRKAA
jgi:SAM-dependent methyltransferase